MGDAMWAVINPYSGGLSWWPEQHTARIRALVGGKRGPDAITTIPVNPDRIPELRVLCSDLDL